MVIAHERHARIATLPTLEQFKRLPANKPETAESTHVRLSPHARTDAGHRRCYHPLLELTAARNVHETPWLDRRRVPRKNNLPRGKRSAGAAHKPTTPRGNCHETQVESARCLSVVRRRCIRRATTRSMNRGGPASSALTMKWEPRSILRRRSVSKRRSW